MHSIEEINSQELAQWLQQEETIRLIDVRSESEVARGTIPNSEHLPLHLIPVKANDLKSPEKFVLFCHSGARSAQACQFLKSQGHDNVFNLRGGILAWHQAGQPIN